MNIIKNIFDIPALLPDFYKKPWLVVGSGPSIREFHQITPDNYNVWCINNTFRMTRRADIVAARDPQVITVDKILESEILYYDVKFFITDFMNHNMLPHILKQRTFFISYACSNEFSPGIPVFPTGSSSPMAFLILGILGVKEIFSIGLDGGIGRVADLVTNEQNQNTDYSHHNDACAHWANAFKIKWTRL